MKEIVICLKEYINEKDYKSIEELNNLCIEEEQMYLKLELDFKLSISETRKEQHFENINEFLCYSGDMLIGYLGICNFGGEDGELTGMIHPLYRGKGIFKKLYNLAKEECKRRGFKKILLVCDNKAHSGLEFIKAMEAEYSFSEYEMKLANNIIDEAGKKVTLRKASNNDAEEISRQNGIYFGDDSKTIILPEEEEKRNRITYMIELNSEIIGKIRVNFEDTEGFISGFGILPEFRKRGYGREALKSVLYLLNKNNISRAALSVAAENKKALNLYKSCGFEEESVMDYYEGK